GAHQCIHLDRASAGNGRHDHATPAMHEAESRKRIAMTPIPKLDQSVGRNGHGPYGTPLARIPRVDEAECVGCNLCSLVCPVEGCITMERVENHLAPQSWEERTGGASAPGRNCD